MKKFLFSLLIVELLVLVIAIWQDTSPQPPDQVVTDYIASLQGGDYKGNDSFFHPEMKGQFSMLPGNYKIGGYEIVNKVYIKSEHYFVHHPEPVVTKEGDVLVVVNQREMGSRGWEDVEYKYLLRRWKGEWYIRAMSGPTLVVL